ncbi:MAG: hypothetical protein V2B15_04650 [Bacteroidota bacterium]
MSGKKEQIYISITGLRELKFIYKDPGQYFPGFAPKDNKIEVEIQMKYAWNLEDGQFGVFTAYLFKYSKDEESVTVLEYLCATDFHVKELKKYVTQDGEKGFSINKDLEKSLARMAVAHGRGMLFQKTSLTALKGVVFPLIDLNAILVSNFPDKLNKTKSHWED